MIRNLEETVKIHNATPGSPEAAIENLINCTNAFGYDAGNPDPICAHVTRFGLKAVPSLIDHLEDHRLTRSPCLEGGFGSRPSIVELGWVASRLLHKLSG
ncbi:MAG: hypothetical protein ACHQ50_17985, partial [Fimbriimonadales bacterium]